MPDALNELTWAFLWPACKFNSSERLTVLLFDIQSTTEKTRCAYNWIGRETWFLNLWG